MFQQVDFLMKCYEPTASLHFLPLLYCVTHAVVAEAGKEEKGRFRPKCAEYV